MDSQVSTQEMKWSLQWGEITSRIELEKFNFVNLYFLEIFPYYGD